MQILQTPHSRRLHLLPILRAKALIPRWESLGR